MELPSYFNAFLREIRPRQDQLDSLRAAHNTLRERIRNDPGLAPIYVSDFLQGSYRRSTATRPLGGEKGDVDVIVVTNLDSMRITPDQALNRFVPFLRTHYPGKWERQGRSLGIELSTLKLDLVVTAAPSEAQKSLYTAESVRTSYGIEELPDWRLVRSWPDLASRQQFGFQARLEQARKEAEWKMAPLQIPDRDAQQWQPTNPLAQIQWTWDKNKRCNGHYVNVVKAIKWWRRRHSTPKYPKSYPLEHLIGDCCPDNISSVAAGVTATLETITHRYQATAPLGLSPYLPDRGVHQDVFLRVTGQDFAAFHRLAKEASKVAREALDDPWDRSSVAAWRRLFGDRFPERV